MEKTIEIPFGAKDSELKGWEYTIPENMEAEIKDVKIIVKQKESEDEGIRKFIIDCIDELRKANAENAEFNGRCSEALAYLKRQKGQKPASGNSEKPNNHAEWSEEDEKNFEWFDKFFRTESVIVGGKDIPQDKYLWFKSLHPKPRWKPSEEQMEALKGVVDEHWEADGLHPLYTLYDDLQKLL